MITAWEKKRKLVQLPGTGASPELVLARCLEKARHGHIKSIAVSIEWDDETYATDCSDMLVSKLLLHILNLETSARQSFEEQLLNDE
jgi:hypothetical protein